MEKRGKVLGGTPIARVWGGGARGRFLYAHTVWPCPAHPRQPGSMTTPTPWLPVCTKSICSIGFQNRPIYSPYKPLEGHLATLVPTGCRSRLLDRFRGLPGAVHLWVSRCSCRISAGSLSGFGVRPSIR